MEAWASDNFNHTHTVFQLPSTATILAIFTSKNREFDVQQDFQVTLKNMTQAINLAVSLNSFIGELFLLETKPVTLLGPGSSLGIWMLNSLTRLWLIVSRNSTQLIQFDRRYKVFEALSNASRRNFTAFLTQKIGSDILRRSAVLLTQITCNLLFLDHISHALQQEVCHNLVIFISAWRSSALIRSVFSESVLPALCRFSEDQSRLRQCGSDLKVKA